MARIVVIEDDFNLSRIIRDVLRESGHEVISYPAPSGDTLEHVRNYGPDLVIVDARLNSSVSGWNIVAGLKADERTQRIPVIVCSGAAREIEERREWLDSLGVPVVVKPFDVEDLESLVERMLGRESGAASSP